MSNSDTTIYILNRREYVEIILRIEEEKRAPLLRVAVKYFSQITRERWFLDVKLTINKFYRGARVPTFTSAWKHRERKKRDVWVERKVTHVPHPRHARVKHARFTHVLTDVPARIRHRTTRVSAILYDPRRPAYRCALHIHMMTARRGSARSRCSTSPFGRCRRTGVHNFSSALNSALIDSACQAFRYQSAYGTRRHSRGTSFFDTGVLRRI